MKRKESITKKLVLGLLAILIILATLSSALAATTISASQIDFKEGADGTWDKRFTMLVSSGFTGSEAEIYASGIKDMDSGAYATRNLIFGTETSKYTCEYKYISAREPLEKYYVHPDMAGLICLLWQQPGKDKCSADYFSSTEFQSKLGPHERVIYTFKVIGFGIYAVIQQDVYDTGFAGQSIPEFDITWKVSSEKSGTTTQTTETTTWSSKGDDVIYLKYGGKQVARLEFLGGGLSTKYKCPEAATGSQKAIQNYGSTTFDLVDGRILDNIKNKDDTFKTDFEKKFGGILAPTKSGVETWLNEYINNMYSQLTVQNYMLGQDGGRYPVTSGGVGKLYNVLGDTQTSVAGAKIPIIPLYNLEVQADWIGVIRPIPKPTIKIIEDSISIKAGEGSKLINAEIGNVGTGKGQIKYYGTCDNSLVFVEEGYVSVDAGSKVTKQIRISSSAVQKIATTCTVYASVTETNKVYDTVGVNSEGRITCEQGEQQCFGSIIKQCIDNVWTQIKECPGDTICRDYRVDVNVGKTNAICKESGKDQCKIDNDCVAVLQPDKPNFVRTCVNPLIGYNYCDWQAPGKTQCSNGIDDDKDGKVDLEDPACKTLEGKSEKSLIEQIGILPLTLTVLGLLSILIFGSLMVKAQTDEESGKAWLFGGLTILGAVMLVWGAIVWLGLLLSILLVVSIAIIFAGVMILKVFKFLGAQVGGIVLGVGVLMLLVVMISILIKIFVMGSLLSSLFGFSLV